MKLCSRKLKILLNIQGYNIRMSQRPSTYILFANQESIHLDFDIYLILAIEMDPTDTAV